MVDLSVFSRIDYWSFSAVPVDRDFEGQSLGQATAFFQNFGDQTYLITAWHVVSGRNFQTGSNCSNTGAQPSHLTIWWNPEGKPGYPKFSQRVSLYDAENEPKWIEIKNGDTWIDVAILPIDVPHEAQAYPINELPEGVTPHGMGGDLFILGFPLNDQALKLPIWKRASLASEPEIPEILQPYWLVDTASRSGMSGSPVIQRTYNSLQGMAEMIDRITNPGHRGTTSFVGVYSGRFEGKSPQDAQLGIVWPSWWIARLIKRHIGEEAYSAGLDGEQERRRRVSVALSEALKFGGRAKKSDD